MKKDPKGQRSKIIDEILRILSSKTMAELANRQAVKDEIKKNINIILTENKSKGIVTNVSFTKYLFQ